jgi:cysteine desulfurase
MMRIYLDNNASMPLWPEAKEAVVCGLDLIGNPSASHRFGAECAHVLESTRRELLEHLDVHDGTLIFTSGATESNFLALHGLKPHVKAFVVGATEHPSLLKPLEGPAFEGCVHICPVNEAGLISPEVLAYQLKNVTPPFCVSIGAVNHETGVVQDIEALADVVHGYGGWLHTDAAQVLGKVPFHCNAADLITLSSHKAGGPLGIGGLVLKDHVPFTPFMLGGGQEMGLRSGTPAVALACGFATATRQCLSATHKAHLDRCEMWRNELEDTLIALGASIMGHSAPRVPQTSCIAMPHVSRDIQIVAFDRVGIAISAGSACQSGATGPSSTLRAMGLPSGIADTAIRVSMGPTTKKNHIERFITEWKAIHHNHARGTSYVSAA